MDYQVAPRQISGADIATVLNEPGKRWQNGTDEISSSRFRDEEPVHQVVPLAANAARQSPGERKRIAKGFQEQKGKPI